MYAKAQPKLEAEQRLEELAAVQAATNNMDPTDRKNYITELRQRSAAGRPVQRAARPSSLDELAKVGGTRLIVVEDRPS